MKTKNELKKAHKTIFCLLLLFIFLLILGNCPWFNDHASYIGALFTGFSIISAAFSLRFQILESRKIQDAEFLLNLNQAFVETSDYQIVYDYLEYEYYTDSKLHQTAERKQFLDSYKVKGTPVTPSRFQISNYLTFFESMYLLLTNDTLDIKLVNDLFAYRFFLAAHSSFVHREKLVSQLENFKNIVYLEKIWMDYRKANHMQVFREDNCLENACRKKGASVLNEYNSILGEMG